MRRPKTNLGTQPIPGTGHRNVIHVPFDGATYILFTEAATVRRVEPRARVERVELRDDLGALVPLSDAPVRVVSLVPSLTEALAVTCPHLLAAATDWCTHSAGLDVPRVRGTKNPDLDAIAALQPDLVIANKEENRELDVERLRGRGIPVWVTDNVDVPSALASMRRLFAVLTPEVTPQWLEEAERLWAQPPPRPPRRVAVPIWRDPWMVVGGATYTDDVLARLGLVNVFADWPRYPHVELAEIDRPDLDLVLLPDEPYVFTPTDGPEAFAHVPTALVSGRLLTWYGPAMVEAWRVYAETTVLG